MNTPPPETQIAESETLEQIAERIVLEVAANPELVSYPDAGDRQLWYRAILQVLRNERERAAKVADRMRPSGGRMWTEEQSACFEALTECAKAIREGR